MLNWERIMKNKSSSDFIILSTWKYKNGQPINTTRLMVVSGNSNQIPEANT